MEEKKTTAKAESTEATPKVEATKATETKKSKGGLTAFFFGIGGVMVAIIVLCICCCLCFAYLTTTDDFKEEYCSTLLEEDGDFENDFLDVCDEYVQDSIDEAFEDYSDLFDDYDWDFDYSN